MNKNEFIKEALNSKNDFLVGKLVVMDRYGKKVDISNHTNEMENIMNGLAFIAMKDISDGMETFNNLRDEFGAMLTDAHKHSYNKLLKRGGNYRSDIINNLKLIPEATILIVNCAVISKNYGEVILEHTRLNTSVSSDINSTDKRIPIKAVNNSNISDVVDEILIALSERPNNPNDQFKILDKYINNSEIGVNKAKETTNSLSWD